jgi:hypothetical protein
VGGKETWTEPAFGGRNDVSCRYCRFDCDERSWSSIIDKRQYDNYLKGRRE